MTYIQQERICASPNLCVQPKQRHGQVFGCSYVPTIRHIFPYAICSCSSPPLCSIQGWLYDIPSYTRHERHLMNCSRLVPCRMFVKEIYLSRSCWLQYIGPIFPLEACWFFYLEFSIRLKFEIDSLQVGNVGIAHNKQLSRVLWRSKAWDQYPSFTSRGPTRKKVPKHEIHWGIMQTNIFGNLYKAVRLFQILQSPHPSPRNSINHGYCSTSLWPSSWCPLCWRKASLSGELHDLWFLFIPHLKRILVFYRDKF